MSNTSQIIKASVARFQAISTFHLVKDHLWKIIKEVAQRVPATSPWDSMYSESSLTYRNHKTGMTVKITLGCEIFVDRRMKNKEYKSDKFVFQSIEAAAAKFEEIMQPYMKPLS